MKYFTIAFGIYSTYGHTCMYLWPKQNPTSLQSLLGNPIKCRHTWYNSTALRSVTVKISIFKLGKRTINCESMYTAHWKMCRHEKRTILDHLSLEILSIPDQQNGYTTVCTPKNAVNICTVLCNPLQTSWHFFQYFKKVVW